MKHAGRVFSNRFLSFKKNPNRRSQETVTRRPGHEMCVNPCAIGQECKLNVYRGF